MDLYQRIFSTAANDLDIESRAVALAFSIVKFSSSTPRDLRSLQRAREYVHAHFSENLTLARVARAAGVHPVYLGQIFRQEFGETLGEYLNRIRVRAAAAMLANSDLPLTAVAVDLGFYDQSHFTRVFRQLTGATPGTFRNEYAPNKSAARYDTNIQVSFVGSSGGFPVLSNPQLHFTFHHMQAETLGAVSA